MTQCFGLWRNFNTHMIDVLQLPCVGFALFGVSETPLDAIAAVEAIQDQSINSNALYRISIPLKKHN